MNQDNCMQQASTVAVCICTAARPAQLHRVLDELRAADFNSSLMSAARLVIVDNRPDTGARHVAEAHAALLPVAVDYCVEAVSGIAHARNRAVAVALGHGADAVAFLDDDDLPRADWLLELLQVWHRSRADMVFGGACHPPGSPIPRTLRRLDQFRPQQLDVIGADGLPRGVATCNVLFSRRLLAHFARKGEVFAPALRSGSDIEFFLRAKAAGFTFAVAPRSQVVLGWERHRYTWGGVLHRRFDRGMARTYLALQQGTPLHEQRRQGWRRLRRALIKLPRRLSSRDSAAQQAVRIVEHAGEVAATLGLRSTYYSPAGLSRSFR